MTFVSMESLPPTLVTLQTFGETKTDLLGLGTLSQLDNGAEVVGTVDSVLPLDFGGTDTEEKGLEVVKETADVEEEEEGVTCDCCCCVLVRDFLCFRGLLPELEVEE